ncbi:Protein CHUP1, chloroplastic [Linum perenne]
MLKQEEQESLMHYLKKEVEAALVRNDQLERQNQELRQEVVHLKSQISALKAHENERKSMLWKKLQSFNDHQKPQQQQHLKVPEQSLEQLSSRPSIPSQGMVKAPPPAPPPPPSKTFVGLKSIRRVPEVIEFYRMVTKKDMDANKNRFTTSTTLALTTDMIGEIENRSTYVSAIKSDVEKQKQLITWLIKEVEFAAFEEISEVETFIKWLDEQLSSLVDERAVLKHFPQWPEQKVDALREAASNYHSLRNLESEVSLFEDNPKEPLMKALAKMQALQERLEKSINNMEKTRESMIKRYNNFQIPWKWLLNTGFLGQVLFELMII